jgi:hypothetical protein
MRSLIIRSRDLRDTRNESDDTEQRGDISDMFSDLMKFSVNFDPQTLNYDLKVPFTKDFIQEKSINYHDKLGNHSNPILQPLLEQQKRSRLKKLWPADLTDG